jgi:tetratricopeptide (TPR) repeat protein
MLPGNASAWNTYGAALADLGRSEDALAAYNRALPLNPSYAPTHSNRGNSLQAMGRLEAALDAHDQALAIDPSYAAAHSHRGNALQALGRSKAALAAYDQALALDPSYTVAHENKGIALAEIGDLDKALAEFDTASCLAPDGVGEGRTWAASIFWHRQDAAAARDRFALVKGRVTERTPFRRAEMQAIALCGLGHPDDAAQHLLDAMPLRVPGDRTDPRTIYDLLSNPPLPGIDSLRAIADNDI